MSWACNTTLTSNIIDSYNAAGTLFSQALTRFLAAQCALVGDHLWPRDMTDAVIQDPNYDFIIVGAGSAGSVVANRLSEISDWKVLLIEAGGNPTLNTETPQLFYSGMKTPEDWNYKTQPQEEACRGYNKKGCAWPRGKVLGGSSSINAMMYVRGNKLDYDEWAAAGNKGWSYEEVLPYFKKSEDYKGILTEETEKYHGKGGYLNVENDENIHEIENIFLQAMKELGIKELKDVNSEAQMGVCKASSTTKEGTRYSTARAFLSPIKDRNNLHVVKNAHVTKVTFQPDSNIVDGIIFTKNSKEVTVKVKKEVILSAGAINTPQILMLSGIGPRQHLNKMGIDVKADLVVGENLQDHVFIPVYFTMPGDKQMGSLPAIFQAFSQFIMERTGPLSNTDPHKIIAFLNTTDSKSSSPEVQFHFVVFPPSLKNLLDCYEKHDFTDEITEKFNSMNEEHFVFQIYCVLLKPKSRGKIMLNSKNPYTPPLIYANYFSEKTDLDTLISAVKQFALPLENTNTFKKLGIKVNWVTPDACTGLSLNSDEFLKCIAKELTFSLYHPTSTAKMGPESDKEAVLNNNLKVRKVKGLRVIDGSVLPAIIRGNTNAPIIMIAEKGADLIKSDWLVGHTEL